MVHNHITVQGSIIDHQGLLQAVQQSARRYNLRNGVGAFDAIRGGT